MKQTKLERELTIAHLAAIPITAIRTKEPLRAEEAIRVWAKAHGHSVKSWNPKTGWAETPSEEADPNPMGCLDKLAEGETRGIIHGFHAFLEKPHPAVAHTLKRLAKDLPSKEGRAIFIMPDSWSAPAELATEFNMIDFILPTRPELKSLLESIIEDTGEENPFVKDDIDEIVASAAGLAYSEAENAFAKAIVRSDEFGGAFPNISAKNFASLVQAVKTEAINKSGVLEIMQPVSPDEIGGLDLLKGWLSDTAQCFTPEAAAFGVAAPKGIMVVGPPGCGKSLVAKATSAIFRKPFIRFDIGSVFGSLVGQSEERIRGALKQLDAVAPCVVLIDEVDKGLGGSHNSGGDSGVTKRVLGAILTHMQESTAGIFWVFTANRVGNDVLPPELVRKGRIDEVWNVAPPNAEERQAILEIHLRKSKQDPDRIDLLEVVEASEGYVSAEIEGAVKEAVKFAFVNNLTRVTPASLLKQFEAIKPMSKAFAKDFEAMRQWADNNARPSSSPTGPAKKKAGEQPAPTRRRRIGGNA